MTTLETLIKEVAGLTGERLRTLEKISAPFISTAAAAALSALGHEPTRDERRELAEAITKGLVATLYRPDAPSKGELRALALGAGIHAAKKDEIHGNKE